LSDESYVVTTMWPFPFEIEASTSYAMYPGCDGRAAETCHSWFGNTIAFSGYVYVPRIEETML